MVANPYASPTEVMSSVYNAWHAGEVAGGAIYVWDARMGTGYGNFVAHTINSVTPFSMDAFTSFQIRAMHDNDSLVFHETDKTATPSSHTLLKASPDHIALMIYDGNYHPWDVLNIHFNNEARAEEDELIDARKLSSPDFNFYSLSSEGQKLTIDQRPLDTKTAIPLGLTSNYKQDFIVKAEDVALPEGSSLYLHDKLLQQYVLLQQGTEYRFSIGDDQATQGDQRFELSLLPTTDAGQINVNIVPNPASEEVKVNFTIPSSERVGLRILDLSGVSVYNSDLGVQQAGSVSVSLSNFASGIYMVELTAGDRRVVKRLVKE
jgi:hypothetical protein